MHWGALFAEPAGSFSTFHVSRLDQALSDPVLPYIVGNRSICLYVFTWFPLGRLAWNWALLFRFGASQELSEKSALGERPPWPGSQARNEAGRLGSASKASNMASLGKLSLFHPMQQLFSGATFDDGSAGPVPLSVSGATTRLSNIMPTLMCSSQARGRR